MPRGFLVKRQYMPVHQHHHHHQENLRYRDEDEENIQHQAFGMFHPSLHHYETSFSNSLYSSHQNPLHSLVERLGFDPHPLYLYSEPLSLSTPPPLDLSIKASVPITPPATPSPSSPVRKRAYSEPEHNINVTPRTPLAKYDTSAKKLGAKSPLKKTKAVRRLNFDEDKSSPVSGTIIRELRDDEAPLVVRKGDIDPAFNVVEVTDEAKAELAKIENRIGDYICRLCKEMYEDAFTLAQHRCSRIVHVEYRCPECDKVFNCPANLASHRRWHKPRAPPTGDVDHHQPVDLVRKLFVGSDDGDGDGDADSNSASEDLPTTLFPCPVCQKQFRRQAYLRKHLTIHQGASEDLSSHYQQMSPRYLSPPTLLPLAASPTSSSSSLMASPTLSLTSERLVLPLHHQHHQHHQHHHGGHQHQQQVSAN